MVRVYSRSHITIEHNIITKLYSEAAPRGRPRGHHSKARIFQKILYLVKTKYIKNHITLSRLLNYDLGPS